MERVVQRILFLGVLITILFLMHLYAYVRLSHLLDVNRRAWHYLVLILLSLSLVLATILCRISFNPATRGVYFVTASWFGIIFILFVATLLSDPVRLLFHLPNPLVGKGVIACAGLLTIASLINAQFVRIKTVEIPGFGKQMTAVQLTDIHTGTIWGEANLRKIVRKTNSLKPDVVFITGDIVSGGAVLTPTLLDPLRELEAEALFVYGNHEYYEGIEEVKKLLDRNGVKLLRDSKVLFGDVEIVGLDYRRREGTVQSVLSAMNLSEDRPTILLNHVPVDPQNDRIELVLSGHTHAGQIFPFSLFVKLRYGFIKGMYTLGETRLYVSPGTGTWGPPMRLGSRNEITLLRLH